MKNKLDYQRYVCGIDLTPRREYRKHIDALLDANQKLYDANVKLKNDNGGLHEKLAVMDRTNAKLSAEISRLQEEQPKRGSNGRFVKHKKKMS